MYYVNQNVKNLKRVFDQNSRKGYLRLDLNENPGGISQEFIGKVLSEVSPEFLSEYPETLEFSKKLANYLNTDKEHVCLVNGSAEGIRYIIEAFTEPGGNIVGVTPTYAMFEVYSEMYGRNYIPVTYTSEMKMSTERIISKLDKDVQLLILVNPNNPVGNAYTEEEFQEIFDKATELEITILVDEAYHYFYPNTFIKYAINNRHVLVTRTFSKLFSMAGARLGYVVGCPEEIELVQKLCTPHNVNAFAELFAQKIIETPGMIDELIEKHNNGREYLKKNLSDLGYEYEGDAGNFIFIKPKTDADVLVENMKQEGILIKSYDGIGKFGKCLRVTTGERKYMKMFLDALQKLDKE